MCREIPLSRGRVALVSDEDYERVSAHKWSLDRNGYAVRVTGARPRRKVMLHRFILDAPRGFDVDHINGDLLDTRRTNIRLATRAQNNANTGPRPGSTSRYKGVRLAEGGRVWLAEISVNSHKRTIGRFADETAAALAYDAAAAAAWGEFARLNFPPR